MTYEDTAERQIERAWDQIEALEAENRRMKEALEKIANGSTSGPPGMNERFDETCARELMACRDIARAALRKEGKT